MGLKTQELGSLGLLFESHPKIDPYGCVAGGVGREGEAILQLAGYSQKGHGDQTKAGALWTGMGLAKTGET